MHIHVDCFHSSLAVMVERTKLELVSRQSGVPKGSVLGPLLFYFFMVVLKVIRDEVRFGVCTSQCSAACNHGLLQLLSAKAG